MWWKEAAEKVRKEWKEKKQTRKEGKKERKHEEWEKERNKDWQMKETVKKVTTLEERTTERLKVGEKEK